MKTAVVFLMIACLGLYVAGQLATYAAYAIAYAL